MLIKRPDDIPSSEITPESMYLNRRTFVGAAGALALIEHVRSDGVIAGPLMDVLDPVWLYLNRQGCHMNRRPLTCHHFSARKTSKMDPLVGRVGLEPTTKGL